MNSLIPYLVFPGTCQEAFSYYATVFGGVITKLQTFEESPIDVQEASKQKIFDAELVIGEVKIKASDDLPEYPVKTGNNFSLFIAFDEPEKRERVFNHLAKNGKILFPLDENFGMVKDQFGFQWMLVLS